MELQKAVDAARWPSGHYTQWMARSDEGAVRQPAAAPETAVEAVEQAYRTLAPLLREVSEKKFRIPPADAEAVVHTVFEVYLRRRASVRDLERYLVASVCNASRDYWRARKNTEPLPEDIAESVELMTTPDAEERLVRSLTVGMTLGRLGRKCSDALSLHHLGGYSAVEIAEKLGTTEQYVWQLLSTCRRRARKMFAGLMGMSR